MKEPYEQGLANQFGLESCAGFREETGEALTEVNPGQPLSSEIITLTVPTLSCQGEGHSEVFAKCARRARISERRQFAFSIFHFCREMVNEWSVTRFTAPSCREPHKNNSARRTSRD